LTAAFRHRSTLRLGARSYLAQVVAPEAPLSDWFAELDSLVARSPGFFLGRAVVLDVSSLVLDRAGLLDLIERLGERSIRIMGLEGASPDILDGALPPLIKKGRQSGGDTQFGSPSVGDAASEGRPAAINLMISEPVRSGQSIICPRGDVTVTGSIASGAEVIAGGSIHVYGTLRGRALAGASGDRSARIFCQSFDAELIAVNGVYLTADDADAAFRGRAIQAWHEAGVLKIAGLKR